MPWGSRVGAVEMGSGLGGNRWPRLLSGGWERGHGPRRWGTVRQHLCFTKCLCQDSEVYPKVPGIRRTAWARELRCTRGFMIDHQTQDLQRQLRDRGGSQEQDCGEQAEGSSCLGQHMRSGPVCSGGRGGGRGVRTPLRSWVRLCRGVCCAPCRLSLYAPCKPLATICATSQIACCLSSHWGVSSACWEARSGRLALAPCSALCLCGPRSCLCPSHPWGSPAALSPVVSSAAGRKGGPSKPR